MRKVYIWGGTLALLFIISGCGDVNNNTAREYKVTLKNITYSQPMSPMVVVHHNKTASLFKVGEKATLAMEKLAEDGNNTPIYMSSSFPKKARGTMKIEPSKSDTVTLTSTVYDCISVATMLIKTNDAFTGINCLDVSAMIVGNKIKKTLISYDSGTEKHSETNATLPGGGAGSGFKSERDDILDKITIHSGVITKVDGLSTSQLTEAHRWDNPTATLVVERVK